MNYCLRCQEVPGFLAALAHVDLLATLVRRAQLVKPDSKALSASQARLEQPDFLVPPGELGFRAL